ncbi:Bug family tripartite tricarboxylate transporter substrate binding protein [Roseomonas sp. BN140053]|uniref:Bug family tripartite tricarboxylate transporter substrate binding protein n=1 Tax=Roseomonas sp. BN140053 TaxID=3391898 RepID=UPI0039EBD72E
MRKANKGGNDMTGRHFPRADTLPFGAACLSRRHFLRVAVTAPVLGPTAVRAQPAARTASWPADRAVTVIVPLAAGGTADFLARALSNRLQEITGTSFVVENRTGGGGAVGWMAAARSAPDGTTVTVSDSGLPLAIALNRDLGFDARTQLEPVSLLAAYAPILVVNSTLPVTNLREFVDYAKARPGQLFYGSAGTGTVPHLQTELLQDVTGIRMNHVAYRGMAQAATDLAAGQIHLIIAVVPTVLGQMRGGSLKAIAVSTEGPRVPAVSEVPSARELGIDFVTNSWFGMMAPRGTSPEMASRMQTAVAAAMTGTDLRKRLDESGALAIANTPVEFRAVMEDETTLWSRLIREKNIRVE